MFDKKEYREKIMFKLAALTRECCFWWLSIHFNLKNKLFAHLSLSAFPSLFLFNIIVVHCAGHQGSSNEQDRHDPCLHRSHRINIFFKRDRILKWFLFFFHLAWAYVIIYASIYLSGFGSFSQLEVLFLPLDDILYITIL
jgi:hypothetical protein